MKYTNKHLTEAREIKERAIDGFLAAKSRFQETGKGEARLDMTERAMYRAIAHYNSVEANIHAQKMGWI